LEENIMKKQSWIFFLLISLMTSSVFGNHIEKFYVDLDQVLFDASGIYIEVGESYHAVDSIVFDKESNRYYALKKGAKWQCGNCRKYNDLQNNNCWYCGWPWGPS
jgi:hypothetical protein